MTPRAPDPALPPAAPPAWVPAAARRRGRTVGERRAARVVWAVLFLLPAAVLALAAWLTPDPAGHGTHTQLGLPPCGFLLVTGLPCPGCGLTTAFSAMMHGDLVAAARANPFGVLLFAATAASLPVSLVGAVRALPILDTLDRFHVDRVLMTLALASIGTWAVRLGAAWLGG